MWESSLRRCSLQRFDVIVKVIATGFKAIVIIAIVIMGVIFQAKVFMVVVVKG